MYFWAVNADDGFAISMIIMLAVSLGAVATVIGIVIYHTRRDSRKKPQIPKKLKKANIPKPRPQPKREAWERDPDWWKKG